MLRHFYRKAIKSYCRKINNFFSHVLRNNCFRCLWFRGKFYFVFQILYTLVTSLVTKKNWRFSFFNFWFIFDSFLYITEVVELYIDQDISFLLKLWQISDSASLSYHKSNKRETIWQKKIFKLLLVMNLTFSI